MSHTYVHDKTLFICNSDLSGEIAVQNEHGDFIIDGDDLLMFVGEHIRRCKISQLEDEHPLNFIHGDT
jgi:hypothetical protein